MKKKNVFIIAAAAVLVLSVGGSVAFAQYNSSGNSSIINDNADEASLTGSAVASEAQKMFSSNEQKYLTEFQETGHTVEKCDKYRSDAIETAKKAGYLDSSYTVDDLREICDKSLMTNDNKAEYDAALKGYCDFITALCNTYNDINVNLSVRDRMLLYYEIDTCYLQLSMRVEDDNAKQLTEIKNLVTNTITL